MKKEWSLYIHWPFCLSKCPYCDFNSHVRTSIDEEQWGKALLKELRHVYQNPPQGRLISIFFGGGTPSLMSPQWVQEIIQTARDLGPCVSDLEVTLEANPTSSERARFEAFSKAGVTRLSLGVQAFDEGSLTFLGRTHTGQQARHAIAWARQFFEHFSFDLIYALPAQSTSAWREVLEEALTFQPRHLSCYQLVYEPGTAFYTRFLRGELAYPDEQHGIDLYTTTENVLATAGLRAYEISNYAASGAECRHNLLYWRYQDYVGIGPGAHGRQTLSGKKTAIQNLKAPEKWLESVEEQGQGRQEIVSLEPESVFQEWLLMGLRLEEGLDLSVCETITGKPWDDWMSLKMLETLRQEGFLLLENQQLRASPQGRLVLNQLVRRLAPERETKEARP